MAGRCMNRLKGKLHVISKRYTQRIERHNLNLRQHLARLGRKSLSFSKSVELHDKVMKTSNTPLEKSHLL
jgi:insertion element IS1 protein InsB